MALTNGAKHFSFLQNGINYGQNSFILHAPGINPIFFLCLRGGIFWLKTILPTDIWSTKYLVDSRYIDMFILRHRFCSMSLKFPKFKVVQNFAKKFQQLQKQKRQITKLNETGQNYYLLSFNAIKFCLML